MKKLRFAIVFIMVLCLALFSTSLVFANTTEDRAEELKISEYKNQAMVDKYIFEEHKADISRAGITVTHTVEVDGVVEIGIIPFTENNAAYFYKVFGEDIVKVVKGSTNQTLAVGGSDGNQGSIPPDEGKGSAPTDPQLREDEGRSVLRDPSVNQGKSEDLPTSSDDIINNEDSSKSPEELMLQSGLAPENGVEADANILAATDDSRDSAGVKNANIEAFIIISCAALLFGVIYLVRRRKLFIKK